VRISILNSAELRGVLASTKALPREVASQINKQTKSVAAPAWKSAVRGNTMTRLENRVLGDTAVVAVGRKQVTLKAGDRAKKLRGGATIRQIARATEFGADQGRKSGKRRSTRQLRAPKRGGYVVYPAAAEVIPRIAALWAQTVARATHEAFEGK
jgi:hypothetical protein